MLNNLNEWWDNVPEPRRMVYFIIFIVDPPENPLALADGMNGGLLSS
jgi:hypothetical protein